MNQVGNIDEARLIQAADKQVIYFKKKYGSLIKDLRENSNLSKVRPVNQFDIWALGSQLEQWESYKAFCEASGSVSSLGTLPNVALDVVAAVYGNSPISVLAATQPISEENGTVYFKTVKAATTRGNVTTGDTIIDSDSIPDVTPQGFAGDEVSETVGTMETGVTTYNCTLTKIPVRPYKVTVTATVDGTLHTAKDYEGDGNIGSVGSEVVHGTINYTTGALQVILTDAPDSTTIGNTISVAYSTDFEGATDIPQIDYTLTSVAISASVLALKSTFGMMMSHSMLTRFGVAINDEVAKDLVSAINAEIVATLTVRLLAAAQGNTTWDKAAPSGISYFEHKQTLEDAITDAESVMITNAGRGTISSLLAGTKAAGILSTLPGWTQISDGANLGAHTYGTLRGRPVVRVPDPAILGTNIILGIYSGTSPFDGAAVYAPYMPLVVTTAMPNGINPLVSQRAGAVWAGIKVMINNFVTKITIDNINAQVG